MKLKELLEQDIISRDNQVGLYDKVDGLIVYEDIKSVAKTCKEELLAAEIILISVERDVLTITIDFEF